MIIPSSVLALATLVNGQCGTLSGQPMPDLSTAPVSAGHQIDINYGKNPLDVATLLTLYKAVSKYPTPVLIEVHGGGWSKGEKGDFSPYMRTNGIGIVEEAFAAGFSVITVQYHLVTIALPPGCNPSAIENEFPTSTCPVFDIQRVVQFIRYHAEEWGLDADRMVGIGASAGGHLLLWDALSADARDPYSNDPVARESSALPFVIAMSTPTDLTKTWLSCDPTLRPALCNFFGACDNATIAGPTFDVLREEASPVYQALKNRIQNQRFQLFNIYQGDPNITLSSQYPPVEFPTTNPHHHVFGLLLKEALASIGNFSVEQSVHLNFDDPTKCKTTLDAADWVRTNVRDPMMLTIEEAPATITNPAMLAPVFRLNLGQYHARDYVDAIKDFPDRNFLRVALVGQTVSPTFTWDNLVSLSSHGIVTIRVEGNVIEIEFAPMMLNSFGGAVKAVFQAGRKDFRDQSAERYW